MIEQSMQARPSVPRPMQGLLSARRTTDASTIDAQPSHVGTTDPQTSEVKTQGEIEAAISDGLRRFELEYMGRGPKDVRAHLIGDLVVIRLTGVLTAAEQHLAESRSAEKGRDLLKQVRTHLLETARPLLETMIQQATGVQVRSMHQDISTATGEEIIVFTLAEAPSCREPKRR